MPISYGKLEVFQVAAAEKSFSRAARKLKRTQPAVSQAIGSLEAEVGERLFLRQTRTLSLTAAGRILLQHAHSAVDSIRRGQEEIKALKELRGGELSLCVSDTTTCYVLPKTLRSFRDRYPDVEIRLLNSPSPVAATRVARGEADMGIITMPFHHPRISCEPLVAREDVVICAKANSLANRTRIELAQLKNRALLLLDRGSNTRAFLDMQFARARVTPRIVMETGSIEVIKTLVSLDFGISIVPKIAVREELRQGTLKAIEVFNRSECRALGLVYPKDGIIPLAAQVFAKMLRNDLSGKKII
jgi:DNA-binding transcriptional LysR family regulator